VQKVDERAQTSKQIKKYQDRLKENASIGFHETPPLVFCALNHPLRQRPFQAQAELGLVGQLVENEIAYLEADAMKQHRMQGLR
jgi:hypothetical protein